MARTVRPPHPNEHDETVREKLEHALTEEVLIPVPDKATAAVLRSRFYNLVRAHKDWETGRHSEFKSIRTKLLKAERVIAMRPHYTFPADQFPYVLVLDTRDEAAVVIELAVSTSTSIPLTRAPHLARAEDAPEEETSTPLDEDPYLKIMKTYGGGNGA